jgi:dihydrofolate reductase
MISLIVCKTKQGNVIGMDNKLPWKQKHDMQRFKALTANKQIIVGRKTWESFGSKPLPNRLSHTIFTRNPAEVKGAYGNDPSHELYNHCFAVSLEEFWVKYVDYTFGNREFMVIGGEEIYKEFLPSADTLYITELDAPDIEGDTFFPEIDLTVWKLFAQEHYKANADNQYDYSFLTYVRIKDAD